MNPVGTFRGTRYDKKPSKDLSLQCKTDEAAESEVWIIVLVSESRANSAAVRGTAQC